VRRRVVVAIAAVATVSVLALALPLARALQVENRNEELLRLSRDAAAATRQIDISSSPGDDPIELPAADAVLAVYARDGRRIAGGGPGRAPSLVGTVLRTGRPAEGAAPGRVVAVVPLYAGERVAGAVRAERSDARAAAETRHAWLVLGLAAVAIIVGAVAAAIVLGRRLAAPLERLAAHAERLGHGDFSARAAGSGIREIDAVGAALDTTGQRLDALVRRERAFTADASHQLRTPLQALRIELEGMELRGVEAPEIGPAIAQVDRLQGTVATLLALARDDTVPDADADLGDVLDSLAERWTEPLARDGRPLRLAAPAIAPRVAASPPIVEEILDVLLDNAQRHGKGPVTVTVRSSPGWVGIDVADEGPGFGDDPEASFERTPDDDGHGIGLALARSLAHAEAGRLTARRGPAPVVSLVLRAPE
jgi:signal transduction histidine kinase